MGNRVKGVVGKLLKDMEKADLLGIRMQNIFGEFVLRVQIRNNQQLSNIQSLWAAILCNANIKISGISLPYKKYFETGARTGFNIYIKFVDEISQQTCKELLENAAITVRTPTYDLDNEGNVKDKNK